MHNDTNKKSLGLPISLIIYCILASITFILTWHYVGIEPDEPIEELDVLYEIDQPVEEHDKTYQVSGIIWSCSGLERGGSLVESLDASRQEDPEKPRLDHTIRKHVSNIIQLYFDKHPVVTQAQILNGGIKDKNLNISTKLLGFQDAKRRKAPINVTKNISEAFSKFGKSRNPMFDLIMGKLLLFLWHQVHQDNKWSQQCKKYSMFQEKHCTSILNLGLEYMKMMKLLVGILSPRKPTKTGFQQ